MAATAGRARRPSPTRYASSLDAVCVRRRLGVDVLEDRGDPFLDVRAHLGWEFAELALDFTDLALKFTHFALGGSLRS